MKTFSRLQIRMRSIILKQNLAESPHDTITPPSGNDKQRKIKMPGFVGSLVAYLPDPYQVLRVGTASVAIAATFFYFRYRSAIRRRKEKIKKQLKRGLVYRDTVSKPQRVIKALELHPSFVGGLSPEWRVCSLGEYLSTLRFFGDDDDDGDKDSTTTLAEMLKKELYVVMATLIMRAFGESTGSAILPVLGMKPAESVFETVSSKIVSYIVSRILVSTSSEHEWDPTKDMAAMPFNVAEVMSFVNLNQKLNAGNMKEPPLEWMERGEIAYDPTYHSPSSTNQQEEGGGGDEKAASSSSAAAAATEEVLVPNPFVVEDHFEKAISGMEERIRRTTKTKKDGDGESTTTTASCYDPEDRSFPEPVPINRIILPDLHLGWGGPARVTHTQRERLRNRLFAVLLTKLSHNYEKRVKSRDDEKDDGYFVVRANGTDCTFPDEFLEVLCNNGHSIEVCPRSTITTFGTAACIREADGSWTNIPLAFFFRTGYESARRRPAYYHALHGGIDLNIKGPLVGASETTGVSNKCDIQFYMAIEGMCGWHSNHNADVPWVEPVSTAEAYNQKDALAAVRMSGILACAFNQIGTEMDLPFGGYGLVGVCNDTAAMIDHAVRGQTDMYPLLSTGRFLMHTAKFLSKYHDSLLLGGGKNNNENDKKRTEAAAADTLRLAAAACNMQSDIHCSPKQMAGAARRYASNYPNAYFQISEDSLGVMKEIEQIYNDFQAKLLSSSPNSN